jgi:DNA-binding NtrC family response regulator
MIHSLIKIILENNGFKVDTASTGQSGLEAVFAKFYHLVFIDIVLPDIDGTELLNKIHEARPEMKKIMITGNATLDNAIVSLNHGADGYLTKPIVASEMLFLLNRKLREQEDEERRYEETVKELLKDRLTEKWSCMRPIELEISKS